MYTDDYLADGIAGFEEGFATQVFQVKDGTIALHVVPKRQVHITPGKLFIRVMLATIQLIMSSIQV